MDFGDAYRALMKSTWFTDDERAQRVRADSVGADAVVSALRDLAERGALPTEEAAPIWYALIQELRNQADGHERALIRHLRHDQGKTWAQVAEAVDGNLGSRQAAFMKWKRLLDHNRRAAGDTGRGGRRGAPAPAGAEDQED